MAPVRAMSASGKTKSALQNQRRPLVAQAFRPANGRRAALHPNAAAALGTPALKGCATVNLATLSKESLQFLTTVPASINRRGVASVPFHLDVVICAGWLTEDRRGDDML